jgi:dUTP pyrophosphatase
MELNQIKKSVTDFVKNLEGLVEKGLGERSQFEEHVRQFAKQVEKTVSEAVWNRREGFQKVPVKVQRLPHFKGDLPKYETNHASGIDVRAAIETAITIKPGERNLVATGLSFEIPPGYEIQVRARSGWAIKTGMGLVNAPGTIDADYRGEVKVILVNWGQETVTINPSDRIAQLVLCPVVQAELFDGDLGSSDRGAGGFGSTGHS